MNTRTEPITNQIETIILYGNRGHWYGYGDTDGPARDNWIECVDGFRLSVIAGGGTYSWPRPSMCTCQLYRDGLLPGEPPDFMLTPFAGEAPHDFHGPYSAVEVATTTKPEPWDQWDEYLSSGGDFDGTHEGLAIFSSVDADLVRDLIISHGGEVPRPDSYYTGEGDQ